MAPQGSTIILSAEDDPGDTIVPRLMAAGADLSKVHIVRAVYDEDAKGNRTFNLQTDLAELEKQIAELGDVLMVEIDPITSYLGKVDSHKNADLRRVLEPLGEMASRLDVTVLANTDLSKGAGGTANSRVIGSVAFVNHSRAAFIVTADPEDNSRRLFLPSKTNVGRPTPGLAYHVGDHAIPDDGETIWAPYVKWEDTPVLMTADEAVVAMSGGAEAKSARDEARDFLLEQLADGPLPQREIKDAAEGAGLAWRTVQRAKKILRVEARRDATGEPPKWIWRLASKDATKDATSNNGTLGALGTLGEGKDAKNAKCLAGNLAGALDDGELEIPSFLQRTGS